MAKKAISPVIAVSLILIVTVVSVVGFQTWFGSFSSKVFTDVDSQSNVDKQAVAIETISGEKLYVKNSGNEEVTLMTIKINGKECDVDKNIPSGIAEIDISSCLEDVTGVTNVVIIENHSIVEKKIFLDKSIRTSCLTNGTNGMAGGDGTSLNPYQICNCAQLQNMSQNLSASYKLISDIDCSATNSWNSGAGFIPIGTITDRFSGELFGNNHRISGVFINSSLIKVGLFGYTEASCQIDNLILSNFEIESHSTSSDRNTGILAARLSGLVSDKVKVNNIRIIDSKVSADSYIGSLAGKATNSEISAVRVQNVKVSSPNPSFCTGGMVGVAENGMKIVNSSTDVQVSGASKVGGFVGCGLSSIEIENSFSKGKVMGVGYVGGFFGDLDIHATPACTQSVKINNTYSLSEINASSDGGGYIGEMYATYFTSCPSYDAVFNSYYAGNIVANGKGFANLIGLGRVINSFWDTDVSGTMVSDGSGAGLIEGKTTSEMKTASNFVNAGWDTNTWILQGGQYPKLAWE